MFFIINFILSWLIWLIFADKKRWKEIFPVTFFAGFLGASTDSITNHIDLWEYQGTITWYTHLLDDWESTLSSLIFLSSGYLKKLPYLK